MNLKDFHEALLPHEVAAGEKILLMALTLRQMIALRNSHENE